MLIITPITFIFVALWHDLSPKLIVWGTLASLIIIPELIAMKILPQHEVSVFFLFAIIIIHILTNTSSMIVGGGIDIYVQ